MDRRKEGVECNRLCEIFLKEEEAFLSFSKGLSYHREDASEEFLSSWGMLDICLGGQMTSVVSFFLYRWNHDH